MGDAPAVPVLSGERNAPEALRQPRDSTVILELSQDVRVEEEEGDSGNNQVPNAG